ncbi:hypothetical protein KR044_001107, partial [Drosophila immigrans]
QSCNRTTVYKFTNTECIANSKYSVNYTCSIKAINWSKSTVFIDFILLRPVFNISVSQMNARYLSCEAYILLFQIHLRVLKKDYSNQYQPFLIDVRYNLCDLISKRKSLIYGTIVWRIMKRFTNVNHSCPYSGHVYSRNLFLDESYIPILPIGVYKIIFNFTEDTREQIEFTAKMSFIFQSMEEYKFK